MNEYIQFKHLLEYFVSHLEWVLNQNPSHVGYQTYIAPIPNFKYSGQGYAGANIQHQIENWCQYGKDLIHINIDARGYTTTRCYMNWNWTWVNVRPHWINTGDTYHIDSLFLTQEQGSNAKAELTCTLTDLGLFDNQEPNDTLKYFFNTYKDMLKSFNDKEEIQNYVQLLKANKNLILTGAPGTGKTYLAKQMAKAMGADSEEQCKMVQFHPSYDYTDFVEGLRPIKSDASDQIGFELRQGVFKQFCEKALENWLDSQKKPEEISAERTFKEAYDSFIDDIRNGKIENDELPLRSEDIAMKIVDVSNNNNIILKTKESDSKKTYTVSYNRLKKLSEAYKDIKALNAITNIYKAVTDAIKGCHTSAYWAALHYVYERYVGKVTADTTPVNKKNFVFIIDEINRGEISKIFGELFFSIDPGYRGEVGRIFTQYQNLVEDPPFDNGFFVPENVYIIGTMNDIDRSVDTMDFAMRRRFAWKKVKATERLGMLDSLGADKTEAITRLINLNAAIEKIDGLSSAYHIGPAYFKKLELYQKDTGQKWELLWNYHLKGLLYEYLRGSDELEANMQILKDAYDLTKRDQIESDGEN